MTRRHEWVGSVLQLAAIVVILIAVMSKRWFVDLGQGETSASLKTALLVFAIATMAMTLACAAARTVMVALFTAMFAITTLFVAVGYVFDAKTMQPVGAAFPLLLVGLVMVIAGIGLSPAVASVITRPASSVEERGATRFGKREGRWHIYRDNKVVEIREYENDTIVSSNMVTTENFERIEAGE